MCGIVGFVGAGDRTDLERMTAALDHRGPDGDGFHIDEHRAVFLGHRRLAIIDIDGGHQPMWTADRAIGVVFNGEIYNHLELRAELEARGRRFLTDHSDTEVLLQGYAEWGEEMPLKLNGMFAFVIYDRERGRLFAARDRFGEKPFYYAHRPGFFAFASELTALAEHPLIDRRIDEKALQKFFAWGYLPAPNAMLRGAAKLPGGHWLSYDLASGDLRVRSYWRFSIEADEGLTDADEPRLVDECAHLLQVAAERRMMSDVPVGVFLSGGLDSSLVLGSLSKRAGRELQTFTIGFQEPSFDESAFARIVALHFGSAHHERILTMDGAHALAADVLQQMDEPLGDASILPTSLLSAFARERVTVALSGDGGDELFAGYDPFAALAPARLYRKLVPRTAHGGMRRLADLLPTSHSNMSLDFKIRRTLMGLSHPEHMWLPVWMAPLDPKDARDLFETPLDPEEVYAEAIASWHEGAGKSDVDRGLEFFTRFYLQDDILMKSDRAAMMSSLETRAVFLDNDVAEFCRRLPHRFKYRDGQRKYLLKKVARRMLPASIVDRKKKGFGIPLAKWLREDQTPPPLAPLPGARQGWMAKAFARHRAGKADHRLLLWNWTAAQAFAGRLEAAARQEA